MLDSEKIIKGLTECVAAGLEKACPADCPYFLKCFPDVGLATPFVSLMTDALSMLKEQEEVEPIPPTDESDLWRCGNCKHQLFRCTHQRYCDMCGREVKWE